MTTENERFSQRFIENFSDLVIQKYALSPDIVVKSVRYALIMEPETSIVRLRLTLETDRGEYDTAMPFVLFDPNKFGYVNEANLSKVLDIPATEIAQKLRKAGCY